MPFDPALDEEESQQITGDEPVAERLLKIAEFEGNLAAEIDEKQRILLGQEATQEAQLDEADRREWKEGFERAVKAAKQKPEKKNYPFERSANIQYPILTSAAIQFGSRAYGAITRGDQPMTCKVAGDDPDGLKALRAARVTRFTNHQLMHETDEWETGTDQLLHRIPIGGSAFRKTYWSRQLSRPVSEYTSPMKVTLPMDAPSMERAPRVSEPCIYYPHEIRQRIKSGYWLNHEFENQSDDEDKQASVQYLEQHRYFDLDGHGLDEPYIVTVHKPTDQVVRIDAAFYADSLAISGFGDVQHVQRESPLTAYTFLPSLDEEYGVYGMGFGQLLESLGDAI
ncbi:MAG: hypothetical protein AAGH38_00455, partial [Pseudomonadota bacterium]